MKIVLFGATGMVGQGVLRECLLDPGVESVLSIVRRPSGRRHTKLREVVHGDFRDFTALREELAAADACFFCLGVSAVGMKEDAYRRVTYDFTLAAARTLAELSPGSAFVYVSGAGTDSSERGRRMWARVKGATENALFALDLRAFAFRPGYIQPRHGATSRTGWYRAAYALVAPLYPLLRRVLPGQVTTTEQIGKAMIAVARRGADRPGRDERVLGPREINAAAADPHR